MNKFLKIAIISIVLLSVSKPAKSENVDYGGIISFNISKSFNDYFTFIYNQEIWFDNNFTNLERFSPYAIFRTSLIKKYLNFDAIYCYIYMPKVDLDTRYVHRYQLGLSGGYRWGNFSWNAYSRFETNFVKAGMDGDFSPIQSWRNKLFLNWHIKEECKWTPYVAAELFNAMANPSLKGLDKVWVDIGTTYAVNKRLTLNMYMREGFTFKPETLAGINNFISTGFSLRL